MATVLSKGFKAADNLLGRKRIETLNFLHLRRPRYTDFLSFPHPIPRYLGRHPILRLRLHRCDECGIAAMGPAYPEMSYSEAQK